jgi:drug/metabolite transporter (DMT)-like permease
MESGTTSDEESAVLPRRTTSHRSDGDASSAVATPESNKDHSSQKDSWFDRFFLLGCIAAWYIIGVLAIVTTKLLLKEYHVPPLVLTMQQLFVGSFLLRLVVIGRDGSLHPWPWNDEQNHIKEHHEDENDGSVEQMKRTGMRCLHGRWRNHLNFLLVGIFNSLDFLFSNSAFDQSAASFVETIKASDPITTTAIALLWKVDRLGVTEAGALILLIAGVLMSTYGDSQTTTPSQRILQDDATDTALRDSIFTAVVVMAANLCFGFRAMNQKKFRSAEKQPMDDVNLYCRMTQIGATFLCVPFLFFYAPSLLETVSEQPIEVKLTYFKMATLNSISYVTYK